MAAARTLVHRLENEAVGFGRNPRARPSLAGWQERAGHVQVEHGLRRGCLERRLAGQHVIEDGRQAVCVRTLISRLALSLLGRNVGRIASHLVSDRRRQWEVDDLYVPGRTNQNVLGRDIPMHQSGLLRLEQRLAYLADHRLGCLQVDWSTPQYAGQGFARKKLHGNEEAPVRQLATIDNGGDPGAGNPHQLLELSLRPGLGGSRTQRSRVHQLEGNLAASLAIARPPHLPGATASDAFDRLKARLWCVGYGLEPLRAVRCGAGLLGTEIRVLGVL